MTINYDGLQLPEGEVQAFIDGKWKSVEFTDDVDDEEAKRLGENWPKATAFKFEYHGYVRVWDNEQYSG